jgi:hypothetical protein
MHSAATGQPRRRSAKLLLCANRVRSIAEKRLRALMEKPEKPLNFLEFFFIFYLRGFAVAL